MAAGSRTPRRRTQRPRSGRDRRGRAWTRRTRMNRPHLRSLAAFAATLSTLAAAQQMPDMAAAARWEKVKIVHYEAVGEITLKGHQIPAADADLYADVTDRVRLSFDWDKEKGVIIGKPTITNETGTA